jgi:hypothetical protein
MRPTRAVEGHADCFRAHRRRLRRSVVWQPMGNTSSLLGSRYWVSGYPTLVQQWDRDRNGILTPEIVRAGSARRVWWRCSKGSDHLWRAKPNNRTRGAGCPFCANRRVSITNSLATCFPRIAAEWHPTKNGKRAADTVVATSARFGWWRCPRDPNHEWRASVRDRTRRQTECPYCSHRLVSPETSLESAHPELAAQWHSTRNGGVAPDEVLPGSSRLVWWQCSADPGHSWRASVANRVIRGSGCPQCARRRVGLSRSVPINEE